MTSQPRRSPRFRQNRTTSSGPALDSEVAEYGASHGPERCVLRVDPSLREDDPPEVTIDPVDGLTVLIPAALGAELFSDAGELREFVIKLITQRRVDQAQAMLDRLAAEHEPTIAEILDDPDMLPADAFGALIGLSGEAVRQKGLKGELLAMSGVKRGTKYPRWQLSSDGRPLNGLPQLTAALGDDSLRVYRFLTRSHGAFGGRNGLEVLRSGDPDVATVIATIAEPNFA
ncbi:MAG: hypothetical protein FJX54_09340 [Alphaproteobacteria bacterium]|nr:hypothetical protein [Alphaproteobacteria bacterium]